MDWPEHQANNVKAKSAVFETLNPSSREQF